MNINSQNVSKAEELLETAKKDIISFGKLFLPDDFGRSETPWFHYEIVDAIDAMDGELHKYRTLILLCGRAIILWLGFSYSKISSWKHGLC